MSSAIPRGQVAFGTFFNPALVAGSFMSRLSDKLHSWQSLDGRTGVTWWCPGCRLLHSIRLGSKQDKAGWTFNGDPVYPTFSPEIKFDYTGAISHCCRCSIKRGYITFYGDCSHALAGQTVAMPDLPAHLR